MGKILLQILFLVLFVSLRFKRPLNMGEYHTNRALGLSQ